MVTIEVPKVPVILAKAPTIAGSRAKPPMKLLIRVYLKRLRIIFVTAAISPTVKIVAGFIIGFHRFLIN